MTDLDDTLGRQRARVLARNNLYFLIGMLAIVGVGNVVVSGSWFYVTVVALSLCSYLMYLKLLKRLPLVPLTIALFCVLEILVAAAVYRSGVVLTATAALFCALTLGVGLVLTERRPILVVTALTVITTYLVLALLQFNGALAPPEPGPALNAQPTAFRVFSVVVQVSLIGLVGMVSGAIASTMHQRTRTLDQARREANARAQQVEQLANQLNEKVKALRSTEETLRRTVDVLSVPALPLADGALAMPLIGYIDTECANRRTSSLLQAVYERRARLALVDFTGIAQAAKAIPTMLLRMVRGARLLGAELVVVGLQPAVASLLIAQASEDRPGLRSYQTLEQAIDYALSQRILV